MTEVLQNVPPPASRNIVDVSSFCNYLKRTVGFHIEDNEDTPKSLIDALKESDSIECIKKFISDPQTSTLFIQRISVKGESDNNGEPEVEVTYAISTDVHYSTPNAVSLVIMKRSTTVEAGIKFNEQLRSAFLGEGLPYESLYEYVRSVMSPYFKSFVRVTGKSDRDGDKMAPSVEKKIAELEMGLLHLQQNIDIPEINLVICSEIMTVSKKCESQNKQIQVNDFAERIEDPVFLNRLHDSVNRWIIEIRKVTELDREVASGTALQEISFWLNLKRSLVVIQKKLTSPMIQLTMEILKQGKRFHATVSFDNDTGMKDALNKVDNYSNLMKSFPLNDLLSAVDMDKIAEAITKIFEHMRKIRLTNYPIVRALQLVEAISRDLLSQMLGVLEKHSLMHLQYEDFDKIMHSVFGVFKIWEDEMDRLIGVFRDINKKHRNDLKVVCRITNPSHKKLQTRLEQVKFFRRSHDQLRLVIVRVLRPPAVTADANQEGDASVVKSGDCAPLDSSDADAIKEVNFAYDSAKQVNCLDVTKEGTDVWESAQKKYDERIDRVETQITSRLRDQLGTARNAAEMFRIFSRFNALFVRQHIRSAIREYQTQLIGRVKEDIDRLHEKFKFGYPNSLACKQSILMDVPPIAGSMIWAKEILNQLNTLMHHVEDVLGAGWENHVEGQKLKSDSDSFKLKLDITPVFNEWAESVQKKHMTISGNILQCEVTRHMNKNNTLKLKVNFNREIITLAKETRNMRTLNLRIPLAILNKAHQVNKLYPYAISLISSVKTFDQICEKVDERQSCSILVSGMIGQVQAIIISGCALSWDSYKLDTYVPALADIVQQLQDKTEELIIIEEKIEDELRNLDTCVYDKEKFMESLSNIQRNVDELSLKQYSNLSQWVKILDAKVEEKLAKRLEAAMKSWIVALELKASDADNVLDLLSDTDITISQVAGEKCNFGEPTFKQLVYSLRFSNQTMHLSPPVEDSCMSLMKQLFDWQSILLSLPRIQHSRYSYAYKYVYKLYQKGLIEVGIKSGSESETTYKNLMMLLPNGSEVLDSAYHTIHSIVSEVTCYVKNWLQYQSLWDLQSDLLYARLGDNLPRWMRILNELKESRKTFDTSESHKSFGPIRIEFGKVQTKVSAKYDQWHKEVIAKFSLMLGSEMKNFHGFISKSRTELETVNVESANTSDSVTFITYVQSLKRDLKQWEKQVTMFSQAQHILERQRFQFPASWLHSENVEGEWSAFSDIISRKETSIQSQVAILQQKIIAEDKLIEERTSELLSEWDKDKPIAGSMKPSNAMNCLHIFEGSFTRLQDERINVSKAKEALELCEPGTLNDSEETVQIALEELRDLKSVWSALAKIRSQIDELKERPWLSVQPRKLRKSLDNLLTDMKELPSRLRQYASYEFLRQNLQSYCKVNILIIELKSDAVKERHWRQLMRKLRVSWVPSDMTLGHIWDVDLLGHESQVREVLAIAQGEMALEEFLKQVSEVWKMYELELTNYQNKCRLIRGWDDLFNKVKEHINSVAAMKLSPFYKEFEDEASSWEDKLNRISALFDIWVDVQRRWVYLDGIFSASADIKHLLPVETSRFHSVSTEFLGLMKKVSKSAHVLDVLNITNVLKQLERLADLLAKIQKALGEYLERERASFPRFYFVGDEDLLEIIGNGKNLVRLQKHFKKMFAGVSYIIVDQDDSQVLGIGSKEGEEVLFNTPVVLKDRRINEWLTMVETEMRVSLAKLLAQAVNESESFKLENSTIDSVIYLRWADKYQAQLVVLAAQVMWSESIEKQLLEAEKTSMGGECMKPVLSMVEATLNVLADSVLHEQTPVLRRKLEHLITELVHQRDTTRRLIISGITSSRSFTWLREMRFYFDPKCQEPLKQLSIRMADASFHYGFEYLGVQDKLVQTPLTDRCYLTMTQALSAQLGGSPFGPAGTGKTESVKALGNQMGRFVLVFNCDETFDFQAMGRIFVGLCQVGAWGCFDEFNRLEERMLSAVSQQIQSIQESLKAGAQQKSSGQITVELVNKTVKVNRDMAIFITMNPGYAGRSNLPDNLKKLFRSLAMTSPDRQLIAQVLLYSQGFRSAESLASKIVPFFKLCQEQLSPQTHYDFGLRALKSVLVSSGNIKRDRISRIKKLAEQNSNDFDEATIAMNLPEQEILIQSVMETMVPKLIAEDIPLLDSLLSDVFPGVEYTAAERDELRAKVAEVCKERHFIYGENKDEIGGAWVEKVLQLHQISQIHHGLMMVGPSGSGKSSAWTVLLQSLERLDGMEGVAHVIDPKSISKDALYGSLDPNTREWSDGLFTHILRKIIDNVRGEIGKRQWIIFDGDVDPEWVENLNSVLDDNKLLTLPNGERLAIPSNVRIMFEVQDLKYATLATVSRCGMVWFSEHVLTVDMNFANYLLRLKNIPLMDTDDDWMNTNDSKATNKGELVNCVQTDASVLLEQYLTGNGVVFRCLEYASTLDHVMDFTRLRALTTMFSLLNQCLRNVIKYNNSHSDFPIEQEELDNYLPKALVYCCLWAFSGDSRLKVREQLADYIKSIFTIQFPNYGSLIDYEPSIKGEWLQWSNKVPKVDIETHKVAAPDVVIPTVDTIRHESLLYTWLEEHKPMLLCGPPGSGKTMTLFSALRALPDLDVVGLNFSSATTPELLLKTFDHYCEYKKTPNGVVMAPIQLNKWLVLFCDEINLPDMDKYGTQRVISFLRQIVERGGFYRTSDQNWVKFERIQFVAACNPPTDPGRKPLSHRFLRHVPVVYVDYPGKESLTQIYGTFNRAMLRLVPCLRTYSEPLTNAMVEFYLMSQERFTQEMQPHYVYSPREMTRWVRGIFEALRPLETLSLEGLVRIWAHESLRLFQDRLVEDDERLWTNENIDMVALKHFPTVNREKALSRPILYSNWLSKDYSPVEQSKLKEYVDCRLKVFYEEELDVPLVLFDEVLEHVLRIDRIFRQPQGHLLLIGVSGAGKTTLSRFVAWIIGLSIFQVKVHNQYTAEDFDEDLRGVLRRAGCRGEKICFIMDESNVLDSSFLERMNTLLANGEVPGLFEGDEYTTLMTQCKEGAIREGLMLDSQEELYKWFTEQVMVNLHVVFTMNPSTDGLKDRAATSPALFNRCVLNWFGTWSQSALYQVGREFTNKIDLDCGKYVAPDLPPLMIESISDRQPGHRDAILTAMVYAHNTLSMANDRLRKRGNRTVSISPRHYLDFINHYVKLYNEKRSELEEEQLHLNIGLRKIKETLQQVEEMQKTLSIKRANLNQKNDDANQKLKEMMVDQQEAERKKVTSQEIQIELEAQTVHIAEKRKRVMEELSHVEPAVIDAQQAVKGIRKQHLVEIRSMANPPAAVKMALESICLLLGENTTDWKMIRGIMVRDNFISTIVKFSTDDITAETRKMMKNKYLSNPDFTYEKINRASLACGPMVKWAIAQVSYSDMLTRIEPLRNELSSLENQATQNRAKNDNTQALIADLEKSISVYRGEYANLISQAQTIKSDLENIEGKVDRSVNLLKSLSSEQKRWDEGSETFKAQMSTIIGDVFLSAAFVSYAGYFDQNMRSYLYQTWVDYLHKAHIEFKPDLARVEYLSNPDDRLQWNANSLPSDNLCVENAIMLKRFIRYPLIIDPSGQATEFIMNEYKSKKITKTSFLDDSFRKNLESALRFGNPLLVQDVESYDAILNPVLNRELRRSAGRVLITLGDQDIDLSPAFTIFLSTRDPTVEFPPDLCSRVTFVNFTVTRSSLQSQCLHHVLRAERPDVDEKRSDLLKLQGEFMLRLRQLEKSLLSSLNESKGRLLDDDSIITHLETLKKEAGDIALKVEQTDVIMAEVENTSSQYLPLAQSCSAIYFTLESLNQMNHLYQCSLQFFLDIFHAVLHNNDNLKSIKHHTDRLKIIIYDLFKLTYNRTSAGMLYKDRITLGVLFARIFLKLSSNGKNYEKEFIHLLHGNDSMLEDDLKSTNTGQFGLSGDQINSLTHLSRALPEFKDVIQRIQANKDMTSWLDIVAPEKCVPKIWNSDSLDNIGTSVYNMLVISSLRPDSLISSAHHFVDTVMGNDYISIADKQLDLVSIIQNEIKARTPILMCSVPGYDASGRVEDLAAELNVSIISIAIGSVEGFNEAEKAINSATKLGRWVMLKNVHLAIQWLVSLEKKLHNLTAHDNFRLFLTMDISDKIPVNLLRAGRVFVFEPPPGVRANLLRTFSSVPATRMCKAPAERACLYFLLAWFHATVQERLRYAPLGWSKSYEFNESDLKCAFDTIDSWVDTIAKGRTNISPDKVPWDALRTLLAECIYGGKIDNEFDQKLLEAFLYKLFRKESFENNFKLVSNIDDSTKCIEMPDGIRREQFIQWCEKLPLNETPSWLGLPNNAHKVLLTSFGSEMLSKLLRMQELNDEEDDEFAYQTTTSRGSKVTVVSDGRPSWMRTLLNQIGAWLKFVPKSLGSLKRTVDNIKDPLFRFYEREVNFGIQLLTCVRTDLEEMLSICEGTKKPYNHHRLLMAKLVKGVIPEYWRKYNIPDELTVTQWITDFAIRIKQLHTISEQTAIGGASSLKKFNVWMGGLFIPEAYITATRQYVAQANNWCLEQLHLEISIETQQDNSCSFSANGMKLQGASCKNNELSLSKSISTNLPMVHLSWINLLETKKKEKKCTLPVYLNSTRQQLLFTLDFNIGNSTSQQFYEQGVALITSDIGF